MDGYSFFQHHQDPRFQVVTTADQLQKVANVLAASSVYAKDYESTGLAWWRGDEPCGVAYSARPRPEEDIQSFYIPYRHITGQRQLDADKVVKLCKTVDEDPSKTVIMHNRKFDDHMGRREGIHLAGQVIDTMMEARLYHEDQPAGLKERAFFDLGNTDAKLHEDQLNLDIARHLVSLGMTKTAYLERFGYSLLDIYLAGKYAAHDTYLTLLLREFYEAKGVRDYYSKSPRGEQFDGIWNIEMALTEVLTDVEEVGQPVDVEYILQMHTHLVSEKAKAEARFFQETGLEYFKLSSDDELRERLQYMKVPLTKTTKKGNLAVDSDVLTDAMKVVPAFKWVLRWRDVDKLDSTYTQSLLPYVDENGVLHGNFQQMGTNTGRLSCRNPNLQNIPSKVDVKWLIEVLGMTKEEADVCASMESVKRIFVVQRRPEDPFAISCGNRRMVRILADYSQVELRVLAHYSQDPRLLKTYREGGDIHDEVERAVFGTGKYVNEQGEEVNGENRRLAKVINFGLSYCMTPIGFQRQIPQVTEDEAQQYFDQYNVNFPKVSEFRQAFWTFILSNGCVFNNMFGRTRHMPSIASPIRSEVERAKRQSIATLIQGSAAEFTKESMVRIHRMLRDGGFATRLTGTVHDENQADGPVDEFAEVVRRMKAIMEDFPDMSVPISVDVEYTLTDWSDKHRVPGL
jgi:DNA polymerase-1